MTMADEGGGVGSFASDRLSSPRKRNSRKIDDTDEMKKAANTEDKGGASESLLPATSASQDDRLSLVDASTRFSIVLYRYVLKYPWRLVRQTISLAMTGISFCWSAMKDITRAGKHHLEWKIALDRLQDFLSDTGIEVEVRTAMNERFISNLTVYDDVQRDLEASSGTRGVGSAYRRQSSLLGKEAVQAVSKSSPTLLQDGAYFMRFATAAYGAGMIGSVVMELMDPDDLRKMDDVEFDDDDELSILAYTGIQKKDVVTMEIDSGGSMEYLRHFAVVDHEKKALIFAVRGTFSVSGIVTDIVAFSETFCGGVAHAGMAEMAKATWEKAKNSVLEKLKELPEDYEVVVTGHSLGAGVACLLTIMFHDQQCIPGNRTIRCMAFAPPPVFYPMEAVPKAVAATTAFIHATDVVPFLSVHNIRRFFKMVSSLDEEAKKLWLYEKMLIDWDFRKPSTALIDALQNGENQELTKVKGAEQVCIPAKVIVWLHRLYEKEAPSADTMRSVEDADKVYYAARLADPPKVAGLPIHVTAYMLSDHFPSKYEQSLRNATFEDT